MLLFGLGWTSAFATIQAAAQLVCPSWVRARALSIFQLAQNGALTVGSFGWGWVGSEIGLSKTFLAAAAVGVVLMMIARYFNIEAIVRAAPTAPEITAPLPEAPAPEYVPILRYARGHVMEIASYHVAVAQRADFLRLMQQVHGVRGRAGAVFWQLYSDVAHPEHWLEVWSMESWTEHLREVVRLSEDDRRLLTDVAVFQHEAGRPTRYLAVDPHEHLASAMVEREHLRVAGAGGVNRAGGIADAGAGAH
jgi:hypothetical protein